MDAAKKIFTGGAYDAPAKTKDGAFTKQGEPDAHTIKGTSADPNSTGSKTGDAIAKAQEAKKKVDEDPEGAKEELKGKAQEGKEMAKEKGVVSRD